MKLGYKKLGHQAPKGYRTNDFNSIEIEGDFAYCSSHNFVYNAEEEDRKLYDGLPCYYTDVRFFDGSLNFFKNCKLYWTRWKSISLRACIRRTLSCRNIPVGTIVDFNKSWYYRGKKIDNSYHFKIRKENRLDLKFEINDPNFFANFVTCDFSKNLTDALRNNGFIVKVYSKNTNFLSNMISTAASFMGKEVESEREEGEVASAYGFGKKIGYSSKNDTLYGYSNGRENVLWDRFGEFNKWSRCNEIPKTTSIEDILRILKAENEPDENN